MRTGGGKLQTHSPGKEAALTGTASPEISIEAYLKSVNGGARQSGSWLRAVAKDLATAALLPLESRRARRLEGADGSLKLHLGAADNYVQGWINIDLFRPGRRLDLRWDLRRPLPFSDGAISAIFAEHLLEHIDLRGGLAMLRECRRVLAVGGLLRIGVPDLERYALSHGGADSIIEDCRPGRPTRGIALNEVFFRYGHRWMYDFQTLERLCLEAGFSAVERSQFGKGRLSPSLDSEHRRHETLYVEALR